MLFSKHKCGQTFLMMIVFFILILVPVIANISQKLDETFVPPQVVPNPNIKCTICSCDQNLCGQQLPPPPVPPLLPPKNQYCSGTPQTQLLPPPPPRFVYVTGPPENLNPTDMYNSPPPRFVYVTGPPGNLNPTDMYNSVFYSGGGQGMDMFNELVVLVIGCGLLEVLLLFW